MQYFSVNWNINWGKFSANTLNFILYSKNDNISLLNKPILKKYKPKHRLFINWITGNIPPDIATKKPNDFPFLLNQRFAGSLNSKCNVIDDVEINIVYKLPNQGAITKNNEHKNNINSKFISEDDEVFK